MRFLTGLADPASKSGQLLSGLADFSEQDRVRPMAHAPATMGAMHASGLDGILPTYSSDLLPT